MVRKRSRRIGAPGDTEQLLCFLTDKDFSSKLVADDGKCLIAGVVPVFRPNWYSPGRSTSHQHSVAPVLAPGNEDMFQFQVWRTV